LIAPTWTSPVWHPFTQHGLAPASPVVVRAEGAWLELESGARMLDAISSWWVITHGHCHPRIVAAIQDQAARLDQVIFAGFTHVPAEETARKLLSIVPPGLSHVFYSDSGSTAVEVGLKMALGYWKNRGINRTRIIAMSHAYHGDTVGTMSAGARGVFNAAYAPLLFDAARIPFPEAGQERRTLDTLEHHAKGAAALVVEPLICGAGGMRLYSPEVLRDMAGICARHGTLFVADEVMTGFGRTGTLFACEQAGITPDIMAVAKGLTGGVIPLSATLCKPEVFAAHYSTHRGHTFFHSSSFTANPLACAAASANLDVWLDEPVLERVNRLCALQEENLELFRADPRFENVRRAGTITAMDLKVDDPGYMAGLGPEMTAFFHARGILLRPLGNTIYVMPPYCITAGELATIYAVIKEAAAQFA
jgi:adenosylmethionine-8-amino-7-oxononanoate aminotransferase